MGLDWILRRFAFALKMSLALFCILCLGFALSVPSTRTSFSETKPATQRQTQAVLPVFYLSFQPYALPPAFSKLAAGPHKRELGKLMLRYGQEAAWIAWFNAAIQKAELPNPKTMAMTVDLDNTTKRRAGQAITGAPRNTNFVAGIEIQVCHLLVLL